MGTLYIVATPIGNLSDMSVRAIDTLKASDYILCENLRTSKRFLKHYEIDTYLITYRDETRNRVTPQVLTDLSLGKTISLISDNGTPLISDPGFKLVEQARMHNYNVVPIPGPSAVIAALSVSGLPTDKFSFVGFLPKKGGQRTQFIKEYGALEGTIVFYESPHRIKRLIDDIIEILGDRFAFLIREMTKIHEQSYKGNLSQIKEELSLKNTKGEYVLLVAKEDFNARSNI